MYIFQVKCCFSIASTDAADAAHFNEKATRLALSKGKIMLVELIQLTSTWHFLGAVGQLPVYILDPAVAIHALVQVTDPVPPGIGIPMPLLLQNDVGIVLLLGPHLAEDNVALLHLAVVDHWHVDAQVVGTDPGPQRPARRAVRHRLALLQLVLDEFIALLAQTHLFIPAVRSGSPVNVAEVAHAYLVRLRQELRRIPHGARRNDIS